MTDRFDDPGRILATGDLFVILAVVAWGIVDHHGISGLLELRETAETIAPFVLGFVVVALLAGTYRTRSQATLATSLRSVTVAWLGGANLGFLLRGSPFLPGGNAWPFPVVLTVTVLVGLLAWRAIAWRLLDVGTDADEPAGG